MPIFITRPSETPVETQFYDELRRLIESGEYRAGKLLSVNELADVIILPPPKVKAILERLVREGYLKPSEGRGLFVVVL